MSAPRHNLDQLLVAKHEGDLVALRLDQVLPLGVREVEALEDLLLHLPDRVLRVEEEGRLAACGPSHVRQSKCKAEPTHASE